MLQRSVLLMALFLAVVPQRAVAEDVVSLAYDVRALLRPIQDHPVPSVTGSARWQGISFSDGMEPQQLLIDDLVELIKLNVEPAQWELEQYSIAAHGETLVVTASKGMHEEVQELLKWLRTKHLRHMVFDVKVYGGTPAALTALLDGGPVLDAADQQALGQAPWSLMRRGRLFAASGQRVNLSQVKQTSYLEEYDVEVAEKAATYDPVIAPLETGDIQVLRAVLADGTNGMLIEFASESAVLLGMRSFDCKLAYMDPGSKTLRIMAPLQQPIVRFMRHAGTVWIPNSGAALTGVQRDGERVLVTVIQHRPSAVEASPEPDATSKRIMRIMDTRFVTFSAKDFEATNLMSQNEFTAPSGAAGVVFDSGAEEGAQLTDESLVEMIRVMVDEDSWHNTRNSIEALVGKMIVRQTPETMKQVVEYLHKLEKTRQLALTVRTQLFESSDAAMAELVGELLSNEQRTALEARLLGSEGVKSLGDLAVSGLPGQKVTAGYIDTQRIVSDYDVEIASESTAQDPTTMARSSGAQLAAVVTPTQENERFQVELSLELAIAGAVQDIALADQGPVAQQVLVDRVKQDVTLVMPAGRAMIVALGGDRYAIVEVQISRPKAEPK